MHNKDKHQVQVSYQCEIDTLHFLEFHLSHMNSISRTV
jgi:hypothetical protein